MRRLPLIGLALLALSCAARGRADRIPPGDGPLVGVYKAQIGDVAGVTRRAKLVVWASDPDRLHAEVLSPVGGVAFVVDAGGGRVAVVDVDGRVAYRGDDTGDALAGLIGVRSSVADAVAALLHGRSSGALRVTRPPRDEGLLPAEVRMDEGDRFLALTRIRLERATAPAASLGTGEPPAGLPVRRLEALAEELAARR